MIDAKEKEFFQRLIRDLTFTPSIRLPELYESSTENIMGREEYEKYISMCHTSEEYMNGNRRFKRLLALLSRDDQTLGKVSLLIARPKIYDRALFERKMNLYNRMASALGFNKIDTPLPINLMNEMIEAENAAPAEDIISKYYPYYYGGARSGVDFVEYIFLLNISLTTHHRTQGMLKSFLNATKEELDSPYVQQRLVSWVEKVKNSIRSTSTYATYIDTFFCVMTYNAIRRYNQCATNVKENVDGGVGAALWVDYEYDSFVCIEKMMRDIIPLAWRIMRCANVKEQAKLNNIYSNEKKENIDSAQNYIKIVEMYINQAMQEAEDLLPHLFNQK